MGGNETYCVQARGQPSPRLTAYNSLLNPYNGSWKGRSITRMFLELGFRDKIEVECEIAFSRAGGESIQIRFYMPNGSLFSQIPRNRLPRATRPSLESSGW